MSFEMSRLPGGGEREHVESLDYLPSEFVKLLVKPT